MSDARTHLEPIEPERRSAQDSHPLGGLEEHVRALVLRMTGHPVRDLRALRTRNGLVVLLTVAVGADLTLREAHSAAGRLERGIRTEHPDIVEVVVHTEPLEPGAD